VIDRQALPGIQQLLGRYKVVASNAKKLALTRAVQGSHS